ncbi:T9SS type A sorting domain-containing protein [Dysgonomonas sp. 520]|uniref:T9SS type A sorting domain-containing protein n=1 Tax=Dysgonomonas sp. 520 TaxID=2302931 RepID=UPI0013D44D71|nr:T9SS type A sorting domain-containing protein [Dysgonomonas sp. 520]NDW11144.1 T9SS C-terminal target domain-containing protein [Dysgonomonas sp. 520]
MKTKRLFIASMLCVCFSVYSIAQQVNASLNFVELYPSNVEEGYPASNALDGDVSTYWQTPEGSNHAYQDIEIELDKVYEIHKVVVKWVNECCASPWDIVFDIDGMYEGFPNPNIVDNPNCIRSINHSSYSYYNKIETVVDKDYPTSGYPNYTKINFPYKAQFVKLYFRGRAGQPHYKVGEIELWGFADGGSSIEKINIANLKTYPNPVIDILNVNSDSEINTILVFDINGKEIEKHTVNADNYNLNTANWTKGTYFVRIETQKGTKTEKIVK